MIVVNAVRMVDEMASNVAFFFDRAEDTGAGAGYLLEHTLSGKYR